MRPLLQAGRVVRSSLLVPCWRYALVALLGRRCDEPGPSWAPAAWQQVVCQILAPLPWTLHWAAGRGKLTVGSLRDAQPIMLAQMLVASLGLSIVRAVSTEGAFQHYSTVSVDSAFANVLSISGENEAAVLADLSLRFGTALAGGPYEVSASLVAAESPHRRVQDSAARTLTVHYVIQCHLDCTNVASQLAAISAPGSAEGEAHAAAIIAAINTAAAGFGFSSTVVTSTAAEVAATLRAPAIVSINLPNTPGGAVLGCTDPEAYNFDRYADLDNGSCRYPPSRPPPPPAPAGHCALL